MMATLVLASASPRRRELLNQIGLEFCQQAIEIDETALELESAEDYVRRVALEKARAVQRELGHDEVLVLGADTAVVVDEILLGKPADFAHARQIH